MIVSDCFSNPKRTSLFSIRPSMIFYAMVYVFVISPDFIYASDYDYRPFEIALFSPVNIFHAPHKAITGLNINLIFGRTAATYGIELGGIVNRVEDNMAGIQIAGIVNVVGHENNIGSVYGVELSGQMNYVKGDVFGVQFAGIANKTCGMVAPVQIGGIINLAGSGCGLLLAGLGNRHQDMYGCQIAALANDVESDGIGLQLAALGNNCSAGKGVQISGLMNMSEQGFSGLQFSALNSNGATTEVKGNWLVTYSSGEGHGLQIGLLNEVGSFNGFQFGLGNLFGNFNGVEIACISNYGGDENSISGLQIAAVFNDCEDVNGLQIGLFNFASDLNGVQLGLFNVASESPIPFMIGINVGW